MNVRVNLIENVIGQCNHMYNQPIVTTYYGVFSICAYIIYENLYELLQNPVCLKQSTATWTRRWHYTADAVKIFCQNISTAKGVRSLNCNPRLTLFNSFLMWFYKPHQNNNYPGNETHVQKWLVYSKFKSCLSLTLIKSAEFDD